MVKERKDKLEILNQIIKLLDKGTGYNYQQIATKIGSHWMTVRECCDFLVEQQIIRRLETANHQWICYIEKYD